MAGKSDKGRRRSGRSGASRVVNASEAAKKFGRLIERVREEHATYVVERAGTPVVQISPVAGRRATVTDLVELMRATGRLDESCLREIERGIAFLNHPSVPTDPWAS